MPAGSFGDGGQVLGLAGVLDDLDLGVDAIARQVGLRDGAQLARLFRRCEGSTPTAVRLAGR